MKLAEMKVDTRLIDQTELTQEEVELAKKIFEAYATVFGKHLIAYPPAAALQLAIGATLRTVKANLDRGLVKADLKDLNQLTIPGMK